jgi:hypothetical protein
LSTIIPLDEKVTLAFSWSSWNENGLPVETLDKLQETKSKIDIEAEDP